MKIFIAAISTISIISCIWWIYITYNKNNPPAETIESRKPIIRYGIEHVHISQIKPPAQSVKTKKKEATENT